MMNDGILVERYDRGFREGAVRLLADSRADYSSETKALQGVAKDLGIAMESLRRWQERSDTANTVDFGESEELRRLHRENAELRRANEILSSASVFRCRARPDTALMVEYIDVHRVGFGVGPICRLLKASLDCVFFTSRAYWQAKTRVPLLGAGAARGPGARRHDDSCASVHGRVWLPKDAHTAETPGLGWRRPRPSAGRDALPRRPGSSPRPDPR